MQTQVSTITAEIDAYIRSSGVGYARWYVGVTSDIEKRMFGDHNVSKENGWWVYRTAPDSKTAREIEAAFHDAGCKGAGGGGDRAAVVVYAYLITSTTVE